MIWKLLYIKCFISTGFSYCLQEVCKSDKDDAHYAGLILFSYPSQQTNELNIIKYLVENNDIKINNLIYYFKNNLVIDNNIYGFVYHGIKIKENNYDRISIISYESEIPVEIDSLL